MATRITQLSGTVQIGESGLTPESSAVISATTGAVTANVQGKKEQAPGAAGVALSPSGVTSASFIKISGKDAILGTAKNFQVSLDGTNYNPLCSEFSFLSQTNSVTTSNILIKPESAVGNNTLLEFTIAGV